jgi:hypothetical protein
VALRQVIKHELDLKVQTGKQTYMVCGVGGKSGLNHRFKDAVNFVADVRFVYQSVRHTECRKFSN